MCILLIAGDSLIAQGLGSAPLFSLWKFFRAWLSKDCPYPEKETGGLLNDKIVHQR